MSKKKKYNWWCEICCHEWKAKSIKEDMCPKCASTSIWLDKRSGKREEPILWKAPDTLMEACKRLEEISDKEVYEGSCSCKTNEPCNDCQCCEIEEINQGHYFEIMDRTHIIQMNLEDFIYNHPAMTPKQKKKILMVQELLTQVYQWSSKKWDEFDE